MDVGVVLQTNPPAAAVVELARRAELAGFSHVWTFDSHLLWQEPFVIYSRILAETRKVVVGPMVTNPSTRDWTVTASLFATLNEMYGNRTICGIGRGDSAVRVTNGAPAPWPRCARPSTSSASSATGARSSTRARPCASRGPAAAPLDVWVAAYGPKALALTGEVGDGFILQLADPDITAWTVEAVRDAAAAAGRDPDAVTICVAAPAYVSDDLGARPRPVPLVRRHGGQPRGRPGRPLRRRRHATVPAALTSYIEGRHGYDYNEHGRAGNTHTDFVPDDVIDRFCILGPVDAHVARLRELRGARRRPVRRLPPARRQGGDPRGLRRAHHPRRARAGHRQALGGSRVSSDG